MLDDGVKSITSTPSMILSKLFINSIDFFAMIKCISIYSEMGTIIILAKPAMIEYEQKLKAIKFYPFVIL